MISRIWATGKRLVRRLRMIKRLRGSWRVFWNPEAGENIDFTGALKPDFLLNPINRELARAKRGKTRFSIVLMDVNNLKKINDSRPNGYYKGNKLLEEFGTNIRGQIRISDIFGRLFHAGDEFILLLPETNTSAAKKLMRRVYEGCDKFCWGVSGLRKKDILNPLILKKEDIIEHPVVKRASKKMKKMKKDKGIKR